MEREDGYAFDCRIPPFSLESKQVTNTDCRIPSLSLESTQVTNTVNRLRDFLTITLYQGFSTWALEGTRKVPAGMLKVPGYANYSIRVW